VEALSNYELSEKVRGFDSQNTKLLFDLETTIQIDEESSEQYSEINESVKDSIKDSVEGPV